LPSHGSAIEAAARLAWASRSAAARPAVRVKTRTLEGDHEGKGRGCDVEGAARPSSISRPTTKTRASSIPRCLASSAQATKAVANAVLLLRMDRRVGEVAQQGEGNGAQD
jgi:hypothetical protein